MQSDRRGMIAVWVLWTLMILVSLALSLGRQVAMDAALTSYNLGKLKAKYYARAGVMFSKALIRQDTVSPASQGYDTLAACGIPFGYPTDRLRRYAVDDGYFRVILAAGPTAPAGYGLQDEERRLNVNAITLRNIAVFEHLLLAVHVESRQARVIAHALVDWTDRDQVKSHPDDGAEKDFYAGQEIPYRCKNAPMDHVAELRLLRGMTEAVYQRVRPYVTVFPRQGPLRVNLDTAPPAVLTALATAMVDERQNETRRHARGLVDKILTFRAGNDGIAMTADDAPLSGKALALTKKEKQLWVRMQRLRASIAGYLRATVQGVDPHRNITSTVTAVIRRHDLKIMAWQRK
jgi:general secretion pathway protein K